VPDPRLFEARLRRALIRYADRCPDDVDAVALAREIAASSSSAGRAVNLPWPIGRSRQTRPAGRTHSMAGASKLAAAIAVFATAAWVATGGTGPGPGPFQAGAPSPSPTTIVGDDWAFFSGTMGFVGATDTAPSRTFIDNGMAVDLGFGFGDQTMVTDDPRMNGTRTGIINLFSDRPDDSTANIGSALVTIANDEGTWSCPMTFIHQLTDSNAAGEIEQWAGWCGGSGGYEGLKAYLAMRQPEDLASSGRQDVYGFITSGDGPPMPEAPEG
jgi:hypothetical protein